MRISINLATHPFVELRPLFARLRLAMGGLALTAMGLGVGLHVMNGRAQAAEAQMDSLKAQTRALQSERQANERRMQEPQNRAVLDRSKFLNALFAQKSFSWTSVMMDLEQVLPAGVQVTSIDPVVAADGGVNIRLRVSGDRDREVDLVRNLEHGQRFLAPRLMNETAQTQQPGQATPVSQAGVPGGVEFDILSGYNPLPAKPMGQPDQDKIQPKQDEAAGGKPAKAAGSHSVGPKPAGGKAATGKAIPSKTVPGAAR